MKGNPGSSTLDRDAFERLVRNSTRLAEAGLRRVALEVLDHAVLPARCDPAEGQVKSSSGNAGGGDSKAQPHPPPSPNWAAMDLSLFDEIDLGATVLPESEDTYLAAAYERADLLALARALASLPSELMSLTEVLSEDEFERWLGLYCNGHDELQRLVAEMRGLT